MVTCHPCHPAPHTAGERCALTQGEWGQSESRWKALGHDGSPAERHDDDGSEKWTLSLYVRNHWLPRRSSTFAQPHLIRAHCSLLARDDPRGYLSKQKSSTATDC